MINKIKNTSLKIASLGLCLAFAINSPVQAEGEIVSDEMNARISVDGNNNVLIEAIDENEDVRVGIQDNGSAITIGANRLSPLFTLSNLLNGPINNLTIESGRNGDSIVIVAGSALSGQRLQIGGDLTIDARNGFDIVTLSGISVEGRTSIRGRSRGDLIELSFMEVDRLYVGGGPGVDSLVLNNVQASGRVAISGGRDADNCVINNSSFQGDLVLRQLESGCGPSN